MESHTMQTHWNAAVGCGMCDHVPPPRQAHTGLGVALDAADSDRNQSVHAATSTTSARQPSLLSPTAANARSGKSAVHHPQSRKCSDDFGGTHAPSPIAVVAAKTTAIRPPFSSVAIVRHPAVSVSSQARRSCSSFATVTSSAAATSLSLKNGFFAPHPVLKSRSVSALQQQPLQYLGRWSNGGSSAHSRYLDSRPPSPEPRRDEPQLMASKIALVQPRGSAASLPSGNRFVKSPTTPLPVAATALICGVSDKALYARPRSASFTYTSLSDSQLTEPSRESAPVEAVANSTSSTARSQRAGMANNSTARGPELLSQSGRSRSSLAPPPYYASDMNEPEQVAVGDARAKAAQHTRSGSASLVSRRQPQQALGTPDYHFDVSGVDHSGCSSGRLCEESQTHGGEEVGIPFTPQAAAGAAGIEIGPAAGEWNLPRIQQRILAARLQAQVRQHFTSAVEILVSVQMSLDADYREASQGGGGVLASGSSLIPAQRAYYADLVGRELQDVAALWMTKLKSTESLALAPTAQMVDRLQGTAESIAASCAVSPGATTAIEAEREEDDTVRCGNSRSKPFMTEHITSSEHRFSASTQAADRAATSTSRPDSPTPIHAAVAVDFASTGHRSPRSSPLKMTQDGSQVPHEVQACAHHSRQPRANATIDCCSEGSEASQHSSVLSANNNSQAWVSSAHAFASSERGMSATSIRGSDHLIREVSARLELNETPESGQHCEQRLPCHRRSGRQPIRRKQCLMDALSTDSSFVKELSSVWDDEILGPQVHGPFDSAVMERVQRSSRQMKVPSINALQAATQGRPSADRSPFSHRADDSYGCGTCYRSSLVSATSPTRGSGRRDSLSRARPHVQQLSPARLPMPSAEWHVTLDVAVAAATRGRQTTVTALDNVESAATPVSPHEQSARATPLTVSPAAPYSSSQHMPERHCPVHSAETGVDAATPPARLHTGPGESFQSPLRPSTPIKRNTCAGDSASAALTVSAMLPTGEATVEMQPAAAGDANVAPASPVSQTTPCLYREELERQKGSHLSDAGSAARLCCIAQQKAAFTVKQQQSSELRSVANGSCDLQQSIDVHISSEHHSLLHLSSVDDDSTATGAADNLFTTPAVAASITETAASGAAWREERVCRVPVDGPAHRHHRASSLSSPQLQASPASAHNSPTAPPRSSPVFTTASSTGVQDDGSRSTPSETTAAAADCHRHQHQREHHEVQPRQKAPLKENRSHQESLRSLSAPSSTSLFAARNEDGRRSPRRLHTRISHAYNYEYKTIVCSDGQPHKRLILCKSVRPSHNTHISDTHTKFVLPNNASQHRFSEPVTPRSLSPTSSPSPMYPLHPVAVPLQREVNETTSLEFRGSAQHHERPDAHDAAEAHESRSPPVDTGISLVAEEHEECLSLTVPHTQPETCVVGDSGASAEIPSTHLTDGEIGGPVQTASPESRPVSREDLADAPIDAAAVDGEKEANAPAAAGASQSGSPGNGGNGIDGGRRPFIFSGDVIQWWLGEDGVLSGRYYNPYRVQLPRADATALKWCGPPVCNLRGAAPAAGQENGANLPHAALDGHADSSAAAAAVTAAAERNAILPTKPLSEASSAGRTHSSAPRACPAPADIHADAPREWLKTRRQGQQHQQPPPSEKVRGGGAHARSVATRRSVPPTLFTQPRHRQLWFDDEFNMFRRAAAAAVASVTADAASRAGVAGATQQTRSGTPGAKRASPCKPAAQQWRCASADGKAPSSTPF
ncbi:hypothetical protein GH5_05112 [Leishmania sp. Ghana 2012 LV757]|uniref:hypothetical protein n=1 Tax=Leishmania sp. Ghana 2012 LV757 TaxID=2803181 RepID=UPI001B770F96|nr:hypothetical protein GH5_05112 [Leishmania sp. Ghana 2012 LV757]